MILTALSAEMKGRIPYDPGFLRWRTGVAGDINLDELVEAGILELVEDGEPRQTAPLTKPRKPRRTARVKEEAGGPVPYAEPEPARMSPAELLLAFRRNRDGF